MRKEAPLLPSSRYLCFTPKWTGGPQGGMAPRAQVERQPGAVLELRPQQAFPRAGLPTPRPSLCSQAAHSAPGAAILRAPTTERRRSQHAGGVAHRFYWVEALG